MEPLEKCHSIYIPPPTKIQTGREDQKRIRKHDREQKGKRKYGYK